jgi:hypothetical protein
VLPHVAAELVHLHVDVLVSNGPAAVSAARRLGVAIHLVEIRDPERYGPLLTNAMEAGPGALVQLPSPLVGAPRYAKQNADFTV